MNELAQSLSEILMEWKNTEVLELELSHQLDQLTLLERLNASELKRKASEAKTKMTSKSPEIGKAFLISPKGLFGGSDATGRQKSLK